VHGEARAGPRRQFFIIIEYRLTAPPMGVSSLDLPRCPRGSFVRGAAGGEGRDEFGRAFVCYFAGILNAAPSDIPILSIAAASAWEGASIEAC